jgi:hypothetical protein
MDLRRTKESCKSPEITPCADKPGLKMLRVALDVRRCGAVVKELIEGGKDSNVVVDDRDPPGQIVLRSSVSLRLLRWRSRDLRCLRWSGG